MLTEMEEVVLSYPKIKNRLNDPNNDKDNGKNKAKVLKNLKEIAATYSNSTITNITKFLDISLTKMYDGININFDKNINLKKLVAENHVILVPNHQSHADYIALNYKIFKDYNIPTYSAGGKNLDIFPIGKLFRNSGCFYIRRSFHNDILYKLTLEAYLFYLLGEGKLIEFFFEGGRSRNGKLLPPRFGLYHMLLESHCYLPENKKKNLLFLPVSIVHEYVPEQKALARELVGDKKTKETPMQLLKLFKLFSYQLGSIHINISNPIISTFNLDHNIKTFTQDLAFDCFRAVGARMVVTPTSLLALILLDAPVGAMKWEEIKEKADSILKFCSSFNIPVTTSLNKKNVLVGLERALDILINNKKVDVIGSTGQGHVFYSINKNSRMEILYFKNTIIHHFLVPWIINSSLNDLFGGKIKTKKDLSKKFLTLRRQLKYEFYLPTVKQFFVKAMEIISASIERDVKDLDDCLGLSHEELFVLSSKLGAFNRICNYFVEGYFIGAMAVNILENNSQSEFKMDQFIKKSKEVFDQEIELARVVKFVESYSLLLIKNGLKYLINQNIVENNIGVYKVLDKSKLELLINSYESSLVPKTKIIMR